MHVRTIFSTLTGLDPFARAFPRQVAKSKGKIHAEYSIKYAAVIIIFLLSGAGLKTRVLLDAATAWRIHLARSLASHRCCASSALTAPARAALLHHS